MTDTKEPSDKANTLRLGSTGKLTLGKTVEAGRGRLGVAQQGKSSKAVTVEVRKVRTPGKTGEVAPAPEAPVSQSFAPTKPAAAARDNARDEAGLSNNERSARLRALLTAGEESKREDERRRQEEETRRQEEERRLQAERERAARIAAGEDPDEFDKKKKKKKEDEEEEASKKKAKDASGRKRQRDVMNQLDELYEEDGVTAAAGEASGTAPLPPALEEEEDEVAAQILARKAYLQDDEYEDYKDESGTPAPSENTGAYVKPIEMQQAASKPGLVKSVKGSERVVLMGPDPEVMKRNLRSERRIEKPGARRSLTRGGQPQQESDDNKPKVVMAAPRRAARRNQVKQQHEKVLREVVIPDTIVVSELASRMAVRTVDVIKELMKLGMMVTPNHSIDADTAELVVGTFGHTFKRVSEDDALQVLQAETDTPEALQPRPPVVTIMGHVDHGKTSLLDALRATDVVSGEAGGITQHIGAYQVDVGKGRKVTFLDTPGHAAFTAMRQRGAKVTDIVVLVVAADDGIMEQTKEAINHAKAANVPIIVAVNKIDKPDADVSRVTNELFSYGLVPEEFGGDTIVVPVSAKAKTNLDKLLDSILVQAEVLDLKANPSRRASGAVVEAKVDKGRGVVATLLVQNGTMKVGDIVVAGSSFGRVRAMLNDRGATLKEAAPALPVEVLGLDETPLAGDEFAVVENEKTAREIAEYRSKKAREKATVQTQRITLEDYFAQGGAESKLKTLPILIKGDVQGSVEAIAGALEKLATDEVNVRILHSGAGAITESDVTLAGASGAIIVGFNVRATGGAKELAAKDGVEIRYYSIIYELVDQVKAALSGMLAPTMRENFLGYAEIRQIFSIGKTKIAGCMVTQGIVKRGSKFRLLRDNVVIHEGALKTLRRFKDDVKEVREGYECGMAFENYDDIREGDVLEAFEIEAIQRQL